ncbi:alpha/beta hydrolase [Flammeovirga aprica]|uniref:Esterase family protein n=1 Tax=Flammeovirga aprica JL-4 TaxID=694437 RepID=A0A7X9RZ50_9BACT|nr:alpha/beta hydrolase-fold protein [Flammeovirga aprica]NME71374.1 esterase family protein [Flammeovirga aprica JL-4]
MNFFLKTLLTLSLFSVSSSLFSQGSKVFETKTVKSEILGKEKKYSIYLPEGYEKSERSYPVLYLLHGYSDNHTGWVQFGEVQQIADKAIKKGTATAMIIVMPDADTDRIGYTNNIDGKWNYEDYFFKELMPHIEATYRTRNEKRYRAIAGLSMGGGGTFIYALRHPELFAAACPLSAWFGEADFEQRKKEMAPYYEGKSKKEIQAHYDKNNPLVLMEQLPEEIEWNNKLRWYIDCGDDDFLYEGNSKMHILMRDKKIPHEYRVRDGGHTWTYWRSALPTVLEFITKSFHQH